MNETFIDRAAPNGVPLFLSRWLAHPLRMGSVVPSSATLCKHMVRCAWPEDDGVVLELGAGTGVISQAFLGAGLAAERLVTLEIDPDLADHLRGTLRGAGRRVPAVQLLHHLAAAGEEAGAGCEARGVDPDEPAAGERVAVYAGVSWPVTENLCCHDSQADCSLRVKLGNIV